MQSNCFVIMSGGVTENGSAPSHVADRCHYVGTNLQSNDYLLFSSLFSLNVPQKFDENGFVWSEAKLTYDYYSSIYNVKTDRCFIENASFDTIGSVFYSMNMITSLALKIDKIIFVTSTFHYDRVSFISKKLSEILSLNVRVQTKTPIVETYTQNLARERHETKQLAALQKTFLNIQTLSDFSKWFYLEHRNYSLSFKSERKNNDHLY